MTLTSSQTDGNGLPDGFDEIGLYVHGSQLLARCAGGDEGAFASLLSPLRRGEWTYLALTWTKDRRVLYVNGQVAAEVKGDFPLPKLDDFPGRLGGHPPSGRWSWDGDLDELRVYRRCLSDAAVAAVARR